MKKCSRSIFRASVLVFVLNFLTACPSGFADEHKGRIWIEPSIAIPSSDGFTDFYGETFEGSLRLEYQMGRKIWTGLRSGYSTNNSEHSEGLKFRDYFLGGIARYNLAPKWQTGSVLAGVGVQVDSRKVLLTVDKPRIDPDSPSDTTFVQSSTDLAFLLDGALTYSISERLLMALQINYSYFPFGEPSRGDFGNTGGLAIGGSLGFAF